MRTTAVDQLVRVVVHDQGLMTAWPAVLTFEPSDPYAVTLRITAGGYADAWTFGVDLVGDVLTTSIAGDERAGAVQMYRAAARPGQVEIWVRHDGRRIAIVCSAADLDRFFHAAGAACTPTERSARVSVALADLADHVLWGGSNG